MSRVTLRTTLSTRFSDSSMPLTARIAQTTAGGVTFAGGASHRKMLCVSHPLVLGLFSTPSMAADAAGALHALGIDRESISVVAHTHADAQALADRMDATAGVDLEDSRP